MRHPAVTVALARLLAAFGHSHRLLITIHRVQDPVLGNDGLPQATLKAMLESLRREQVAVLPLTELCQRVTMGLQLPRRAVSFTVDDGYTDFARAALPLFQAYDAPVTVFLPNRFVDGVQWLWWDRVEAAIAMAECDMLILEGRGSWNLGPPAERAALARRLCRELEFLGTEERLEAMSHIERALGVVLPKVPPERFSAITWDMVAQMRPGDGLVDVGPHTLTHPVLACCSNEQAELEIRESWLDLRRRVPTAVPIFCYPNGTRAAFGTREAQLVAESGCEYAVTTVPRYLGTGDDPLALPRIALENDARRAAWAVLGLDKVRQRT